MARATKKPEIIESDPETIEQIRHAHMQRRAAALAEAGDIDPETGASLPSTKSRRAVVEQEPAGTDDEGRLVLNVENDDE